MELLHRHHELQLRHTFRLARGATDSRQNLIVELVHDDMVGLGEAAPIARYDQDVHSATQAAYEMVPRLGDVQDFDRVAEAAVPDSQQPRLQSTWRSAIWRASSR